MRNLLLSTAIAFFVEENGALQLIGTAGTATSTFTVNTWPTDPREGEAVQIAIEGDGGFTVADSERELSDIAIVVDFGDEGSTYRTARAKGKTNANVEYGRDVAHVYETSGTKTITITAYKYGEAIRSQTVTVTVTARDSVSWTKIWYVDLNGSTTGMPAETGTISHITSSTEWLALNNTTTTSDRVLMLFRAGVEHDIVSITGGEKWRQNAAEIYWTRFGSGNDPIINITGAQNLSDFFRLIYPRAANQRFITNGIDIRGGYDPKTDTFTGPVLQPLALDAGQFPGFLSMYRTKMSGFQQNGWGGEDTRLAAVDCDITNWRGYGFIIGGKSILFTGTRIAQDPLSLYPGVQRHGPVRCFYAYRFGAASCVVQAQSGWSALGSDYYNQTCLRFAFDAQSGYTDLGDLRASILNNETHNAELVSSAPPNNDALQQIYKHRLHVEGNLHVTARLPYVGPFAYGDHGGWIIQNNVIYLSNLYNAWGDLSAYILSIRARQTVATTTTVYEVPNIIRNNTFVADYDPIYGGGEAAYVKLASGVGTTTVTDNLMSADNYPEAGSFIAATAFARGDNFRPITSGAADLNCVDTPPAFDFTWTQRSGTSKRGAHHAAGADASAPTLAYTSGLTIALVEGEYRVTDLGTWSNLDPYLIEWNWQVDGVNAPSASNTYLPFFETGSGDLTCRVSAMTVGGVKVTATSNTLAI